MPLLTYTAGLGSKFRSESSSTRMLFVLVAYAFASLNICADSQEPLVINNAMSTKISSADQYIYYTHRGPLIFSYRLDQFLGCQNFEFQYILGFLEK